MFWHGGVENGTAPYVCVSVCVQYLSSEYRFSLLITEGKESDCFISIIAINNGGKMKQQHREQQVTLNASQRRDPGAI